VSNERNLPAAMNPRLRLCAALLAATGAVAAQDGTATLPAPTQDPPPPPSETAPLLLPAPPVRVEADGALDTTVDATQPPAPEPAPLTESDDDFIDAALAAGQKEVAAAALARARAADDEVRALAAMLETDHRANNDELVALRAGTTSPTSMVDAAATDAGISNLEGRDSGEFDAAWLEWQAAAHANAIARYRRAADTTTYSEAVRKFALATLPTLQQHADRIAALRSAHAADAAEDTDGY
jgi:putative membrane protein